ncbi:MAG: transketolase [Planctomycetes bacterium]|nr:transketolase [Planctomycetota bacterium]
MDAVQKADSGHPGMPMGMADAAHLLWTEFLRLDPREPRWLGRDRFVLSAGHGSMLLYGLMHLAGFEELTLDELKRFRQLHSKTPGHPESFVTAGVETTTGPLGQGFANAVGMAMAERHLVARFPEAADVLAQRTFVICGDGDLMEGISSEAASMAGHLGLSRLVVLYDDNEISIDGSTALAFSEDVLRRFEGHGWRTERVDGHDRGAVRRAIEAALAQDARPSLIACRTVIGKHAPTKAGTAKAHGEPLGDKELAATKAAMGWPPEPFLVPGAVRERWARRQAEWRAARARWDDAWKALERAHPQTATTLRRWSSGAAPDLSGVKWPAFKPGEKDATRGSSGKVLQALCEGVPNLIGGSADLTPSTKTYLNAGGGDFERGKYAGRNLRFGVREHAMGAVMNGMALHGLLIPFGATFLTFTDYARPAMRLGALMGTRTVYVMTHDSIFLGEDGPTHQPVEHLMAMRVIPGMRLIRPSDAAETALAWRMALEHEGPTVLALTRQNLPVLDRAEHGDAEGALRGGYVLWERGGQEPQVVLVATGSEVHVALDVARALHRDDGRAVRVVSLPCWEVFEEQEPAYREAVLPPACGARVSIEAGVTFGWERYTGELGLRVGVDRFGASAPAGALAEHFGLSPGQVLQRVREYLATVG